MPRSTTLKAARVTATPLLSIRQERFVDRRHDGRPGG